MTKNYFLALLFLTAFANAQIVNIPDANFKARLVTSSTGYATAKDINGNIIAIDVNDDNEIQLSEAQQVYYLDVSYSGPMANLVGIQSFTNLQTLKCKGLSLDELDVSGMTPLKYIDCNGNQLTTLDIGSLSNLETLICSYNSMTSLNVNGLTNLKILDSRSVNHFVTLDLSGAPNLEDVNCSSNWLTSLNVSGLLHLKKLVCGNNALATISLAGLTSLESLDCNDNPMPALTVTDLPNLKELSCQFNEMTSLTLAGLPLLEKLICADNQLTDLQVAMFPNMKMLFCGNNLIQSLDVTNLAQLQKLSCDENELSVIDVSALALLDELNCSGNQLSALDVSGLNNLKSLKCSDNQIAVLDVSQLDLVNLHCENNLITTIDLGQSIHFWDLRADNNQLVTLFMKNGNGYESVQFAGNPGLQYICVDEEQLGHFEEIVSFHGYNCQVNSYCSFVPNGEFYTIQGHVNFDSNNNGCDVTDIDFPNLAFSITDGTLTGGLIGNESGDFSIPVQTGSYTVTPNPEHPYFNFSPAALTVDFPATPTPLNQNFCITADGVHNDLDIVVMPLNLGFPGFDANYKIIYKNKGTHALSGSVALTFDDASLDFVNAVPMVSSFSANLLSWDFADLQPFETRTILVSLNLNTPMEMPPLNLGDHLDFTASLNLAVNDETPDDNVASLSQVLVASLDPNDKTCLEGNTVLPEMTGKYVHYLIRFENTGTANAHNIVVKDMIDPLKFDISTVVPMSGSHPYVTKITGNKVEFIFENINLPFDNANNDGYVLFKIKIKETLVIGNTFSNSASIYFDYNFPIVTNTATTTITQLGNPDFEFSQYFTLYPNPVKNVLYIAKADGVEVKAVNIYNLLGQLVLAIPNAEQIESIDVSDLKSGHYFIKINSDQGMSATKFIKQ